MLAYAMALAGCSPENGTAGRDHANRMGAQISQESERVSQQREQALQRQPAQEALQQRQVAPAARASRWLFSTGRSPIDDSPSVRLFTTAEHPVTLRFGRQVTPVLHVRCIEDTTSVIVSVGDEFLSNDTLAVEYRFDSAGAATAMWRASTNYSSIGLWRGSSAIPFIRRMAASNRLRIRFTPYGESSVTVEFDLHGLSEHLPELRTACHW